MGKAPKRGRDLVVKSQFNIHGSRGKNVGHFISDYVARDAATDASLAWLPPVDRPPEPGDGVAFTMDATAISRQETLHLADRVQGIFERGDRAIEQLVLSFSPEYLVESGLVPDDLSVMEKGDYKYQYDDVRLRHAVMAGMHAMMENEGYYDGNMVAAIQSDTRHLHVHAVVYEAGNKVTRWHGNEERGMLKESSLARLAHHTKRYLDNTKDRTCIPTQKRLLPERKPEESAATEMPIVQEPDLSRLYWYQELLAELEEKERLEALEREEGKQKGIAMDGGPVL